MDRIFLLLLVFPTVLYYLVLLSLLGVPEQSMRDQPTLIFTASYAWRHQIS